MSGIVRHHGSGQHFTQVANAAARDTTLSRKARGLLVELLSHQDGWDISEEKLVEQGQEGRHAISTALKELEEAGYLHRKQTRRDDGTMGSTEWHVTDQPGHPLNPPPQPSCDNPTTADQPPKNTTTPKNTNTSPDGEDGEPSQPPRWRQILARHEPNGDKASWDLLGCYKRAGREIVESDDLDTGSLIALVADYVHQLTGKPPDDKSRAMIAKTVTRNGLIALAGWDKAIGATAEDSDKDRMAYATAVVNRMISEMEPAHA